jgi:site-specific recombinase XerD
MEQFFKDPQILRQMGELLDDFSSYLRQERALAPTTVANYVYLTKKFLTHRFGTGPVDLSDLKAFQVVGAVQRLAPSLSRKRAKVMTSALRSFLRYARYQDFIRSDLAACVPCAADWSVASIPKGLSIEQVNRVLASCNRKNAIGRRDYAILLLLARLGLRAGEVAALRLEDFDWEAGRLTVRGKGDRNAQPIPADVGQAIAAYLKDGRTRSSNRAVFLRAQAPGVGLRNSGSVGLIVGKALARAGINCRRKGAHQFRHTLATEMLRHGASLAEIAEVLRHRNPQTSAIYAKVDLASLRTLALPWPGGIR